MQKFTSSMRSFFPPILSAAAAVATLSASPLTHAFIAPTTSSNVVVTIRSERCNYSQLAAIKHDEDFIRDKHQQRQRPSNNNNNLIHKSIASTFVATAVLFGTALSPTALAVSGGGSDYAGLDITTQDFSNGDFSNGNYKGKDFTQVLAKAVNFANSNLQGCRFYNSFLTNANFDGADIRGVSFERANMENVNLKNVNAGGAYFDQSLSETKTLENGDFTDAQMPDKTLMVICDREDTKGTNPVTGVDTRESLMCL